MWTKIVNNFFTGNHGNSPTRQNEAKGLPNVWKGPGPIKAPVHSRQLSPTINIIKITIFVLRLGCSTYSD